MSWSYSGEWYLFIDFSMLSVNRMIPGIKRVSYSIDKSSAVLTVPDLRGAINTWGDLKITYRQISNFLFIFYLFVYTPKMGNST